MSVLKFGRKARRYNPRIAHLSAYLAGKRALLAPPPLAVDYITPCGGAFGMMLNNSLGDCTCAAVAHARQIWTANANPPMQTDPDSQVQALYTAITGYDPQAPLVNGQNPTDQGADEQSVLEYWLLKGLPLPDGTTDKLAAFVEVDPSNTADVKSVIADCGVAYIGFDVPDYFMATIGQLWDVQAGNDNPKIVGGHAGVLAAYDAIGPTCISWGAAQKFTWAAFTRFTNEAYAPADRDWISARGTTPGGMSLDDLESAMAALRQAA